MNGLTTHVLDTLHGRPAVGWAIRRFFHLWTADLAGQTTVRP